MPTFSGHSHSCEKQTGAAPLLCFCATPYPGSALRHRGLGAQDTHGRCLVKQTQRLLLRGTRLSLCVPVAPSSASRQALEAGSSCGEGPPAAWPHVARWTKWLTKPPRPSRSSASPALLRLTSSQSPTSKFCPHGTQGHSRHCTRFSTRVIGETGDGTEVLTQMSPTAHRGVEGTQGAHTCAHTRAHAHTCTHVHTRTHTHGLGSQLCSSS